MHIGALHHVDCTEADGEATGGHDSRGIGTPASPPATTSLEMASRLLGIPQEQLRRSLSQKTIKVAQEEISTPLSDSEFVSVRDGLAKGVYSRYGNLLIRVCIACGGMLRFAYPVLPPSPSTHARILVLCLQPVSGHSSAAE